MIFFFIFGAIYEDANILIQKGSVIEAINILKEEIQKNKKAYRERILLSKIYLRGGLYNEAIDILKGRFPPEYLEDVNEVLASAYAHTGFTANALKSVAKVKNPAVLYEVYELLGMKEKALEALKARLLKDPEYELFLKTGKVFMDLRMYDEAYKVFENGLAKTGNRIFYIYMGICEAIKNPHNGIKIISKAPQSDFRDFTIAVIYKLYLNDESGFKEKMKGVKSIKIIER